MYHERARAILNAPLRAALKWTLMALSDHADEHGRCWPSAVTVGREASLDERTVRRAFKELEAMGILRATERAGRTFMFDLDLGRLPTTDTVPAVATPDPGSDTPDRGPDQPRILDPTPRTEGPTNDPRTGQVKRSRKRSNTPRSPHGGALGQVFDAWLPLWRRFTPDTTKKAWTSKEARDIRARLREPGVTVEDLVAVVEWASGGTDDWARGLRGERAFRDGQSPQVYVGAETLFKAEKFGARVERARQYVGGSGAGLPRPPRPWFIETTAELDEYLDNGLGAFITELRARLGSDPPAFDAEFRARVTGPCGELHAVLERYHERRGSGGAS